MGFVARKIASLAAWDVAVTVAYCVVVVVEDKSDRSSFRGNCLRGKLFEATKDRVNGVPDLDVRIITDPMNRFHYESH